MRASMVVRLDTMLLLVGLVLGCAPSTRYMAMAHRGEVPHPNDMSIEQLLNQITQELQASDPMDASDLLHFVDSAHLTPAQRSLYMAHLELVISQLDAQIARYRRSAELADAIGASFARSDRSSSSPRASVSDQVLTPTPSYLGDRTGRRSNYVTTDTSSLSDLSFFSGYDSSRGRVRGSVLNLGNLSYVSARNSLGDSYRGTTTHLGGFDFHTGRDSNGVAYRSFSIDLGDYLVRNGRSSEGVSYRGSSYVVGDMLYHRYTTSDGRTITGTTQTIGNMTTTRLIEQ
ncbi:hypothetical protein FJZ36_13140 [Candidatus Poribacteria bacterium]|nr:hypothetical protein [Candidatus Poribacteria bacterium]